MPPKRSSEKKSVSSADFVPVQYHSELDWRSGLMQLAPTLLIAGFILFMLNRGGGGMAGRMNSIMKIGKAKPTVITAESRVTTTFTHP